MRIFLAGADTFLGRPLLPEHIKDTYILESFYSLSKRTKENLKYYKSFLLDSGAFSFFGGLKGRTVDWEDYVNRYAEFIKDFNIDNFFELDIDVIVGYDEVKRIRGILEKKTQKQVIPVWHKSRGIEEYKKLCDEYKYIAIGSSGQHDSVWTRKQPEILYKLVMYAKDRGVKVHGLGMTKFELLKKIPFYSTDSTAWLAGNKFGYIYRFNGDGIEKITRTQGQRLADTYKTVLNNFLEWKKFQHYAEVVL